MPRYVIERSIPGAGTLSADELHDISAKSNSVLADMAPRAQWVQSFVTDDKIYCIYLAENEETVREHARCAGFPVDSVATVRAVIDPISGGSLAVWQGRFGAPADLPADLRAPDVLEIAGAWKEAAAAAKRRRKELGTTATPRRPRAATRAAPGGLTAREQEVLTLLAEGLRDREISQRLFISEKTVQHHVSAVLSKFGVPSRAAAAREAVRMGIGIPA